MPVCPSCSQENPEGARFCLSCGTPLRGPLRGAEERKVVTVLFCDLVGFTARSDQADPEDVRAALRPYHASVRREVERFGGTVEKFIGDAVMAVFGAPAAREDDPERAVRAGLRILDAIEELNRSEEGLDLEVRIGVNSGEAVVALGARPEEGEGIVAGDVVNTAARIQQAASPGTVAVGELTYRSTRDVIEYEPLEAVAVKGKAQPLPLWRAVRARSHFGVDVEQRTRAPLIGREAELRLLQDTFLRALRDPSVQLVTVTGEPGVGKTRLIWEFRRFVDDRPELVWWRQGRCLPYGEGITFWPLGEVVKGQAGILESDEPDEAASKLGSAVDAVVEDPAEREWLRARLAPLVALATDPAGGADREESFTAWRRFLEALASARPLVLVFEDLHWADRAFVEFLEHLVDWATDIPMVVVCSARPELYERFPGWGGGKRNSTTISMGPLSEAETARLVSALLAQAVLPAEVQAALLDRCGGNPLYAEEFVRMLLDRGILERRGRTLVLASDGDVPVPETVRALVAARLDTLPPDRKSLLQDASVVGKVFWSGAVASMSGLDARDVVEALHALVRKELIRPARTSSVRGQSEYSFWHLLIRDVAYAQIPRAARARKHRAAAEWIERMAGDRVADHAELLAHHYQQALDLARAAGARADLADLEEGAFRFQVMAGDRTLPLDPARAAAYYRAALSRLRPGDPRRGRVLLRATDAATLAGTGTPEDAERGYREAVRALEERGDLLGAGEALTSFSRQVWVHGDTARSKALATRAVRLLEGLGPSRELAVAYSTLAGREVIGGRMRDGLAWAEKALSLAGELGLEAVTARTLQFRGMARLTTGDPAGLEDLRDGLARCLQLGLGHESHTGYVNLASYVAWIEGPARSLELYREAEQFATRRGMPTHAAWARAEALERLVDLGEWDRVLEDADGLIEGYPKSQHALFAMIRKAQVLGARGRTGEARAVLDELLPRAREVGDPQIHASALQVAAQVHLAGGDAGAAAGAVGELDSMAETMGDHVVWGSALPTLAEVHLSTGATKRARDLVDRLSRSPLRRSLPLGSHALLVGAAMVAEAQGDLARAHRLYLEAASGWEASGFVVERARALLGAGRCLVAAGREAEAREHLAEAREVLARLGASPLLRQADTLLGETTSLTS